MEKKERLTQSQWGSKLCFNSYKMNSRGSAFLSKNNFKYKEHNIHKNDSGIFLFYTRYHY